MSLSPSLPEPYPSAVGGVGPAARGPESISLVPPDKLASTLPLSEGRACPAPRHVLSALGVRTPDCFVTPTEENLQALRSNKQLSPKDQLAAAVAWTNALVGPLG